MKRNEFIAHAREELGTPFHHQGRLSKVGLDCAGLAVVAARKAGFEVADYTNYKRQPSSHDFVATLHAQCDRIPVGQQVAGDLMVFEFGGNPQHLAILTRDGSDGSPPMMIHAHILHKKVVEHVYDASWAARLRGVWRIRGID